jgi:hypothetical protein
MLTVRTEHWLAPPLRVQKGVQTLSHLRSPHYHTQHYAAKQSPWRVKSFNPSAYASLNKDLFLNGRPFISVDKGIIAELIASLHVSYSVYFGSEFRSAYHTTILRDFATLVSISKDMPVPETWRNVFLSNHFTFTSHTTIFEQTTKRSQVTTESIIQVHEQTVADDTHMIQPVTSLLIWECSTHK